MNWNLVAIPLGSAVVGLVLGFAAARWVGPWLGWVLTVLALGAAAGLGLLSAGQPGMQGLGYFVAALLMAAPAGLACALGTVVAVVMATRARVE